MAPQRGSDILLITHARASYTRLSLPRLLETCPEDSRVWVWHNGQDRDVLDVIDDHRSHPRFYRFHHALENVGLRPAINWLWTEAEGTFVSKVDDDSLMQHGWIEALSEALLKSDSFGVLGAWRFEPEDWNEELASRKIVTHHGVTLLRNHWVQGSGHLFRRRLVDEFGTLKSKQSFPGWCLEVARHGYVNGWPLPVMREEHLDDPRHPLTAFKNEAAYQAARPLSALQSGAATLDDWLNRTREDAVEVQSASLDLRQYFGWRPRLRHARRRVRRVVSRRNYGH
ncbi:glycosyltransferase family A protein [Modestobacter sp. VKM Ac-2979]|uniref:glycosyltransferase family A protein n=1 Tax=unclassified Modestobacter TaxID=2643866 RepID=UPI0022AB8BDB|nr:MULTISPECIES: glycosyltransferase family A protein [unclassified Modestobacter]MCZ2813427.1 glycosyltransferase family A protein [Modestobacter sp. VKM Ac-2979]MCZ2842381.1 glycosyltransferase family A protein [Modestobacter sp. VKM Ac-2980]